MKYNKVKLVMKAEDIEFLKDLQHELKTQDNDGTANPLVWGVIEEESQIVPDGYGDSYKIYYNGELYTSDEFIELIEDELELDENKDYLDEWENIDKCYIDDIIEFAQDLFDSDDIYTMEFRKVDKLSTQANSFITKRACKEYIEKFGYNHNKPRSYAMCAYRNFELERLLNILTNLNFNDIKET